MPTKPPPNRLTHDPFAIVGLLVYTCQVAYCRFNQSSSRRCHRRSNNHNINIIQGVQESKQSNGISETCTVIRLKVFYNKNPHFIGLLYMLPKTSANNVIIFLYGIQVYVILLLFSFNKL